jgi:hypothetical protein
MNPARRADASTTLIPPANDDAVDAEAAAAANELTKNLLRHRFL